MASPDFIPDDQADAFFGSANASAPSRDFIPDSEADAFFTSGAQPTQPRALSFTDTLNDVSGQALKGTVPGGSYLDAASYGAQEGLLNLLGASGHQSFSDAYNKRLSDITQENKLFAQEHPVAAPIAEVAGAVTSPLNAAYGAATEGGNVLTRLLANTGLGAGLNSAYAAGNEQVPNDQKLAAAENAVGPGAAFGLGGGVVGELLGATANAIRPPTNEEQAIANLGITAGNINRAQRHAPRGTDELRLLQAVEGAQGRGVFSAGPRPEDVQAANEAVYSDLADQLHGPDGILPQADAAATTHPQLTLDNAQAFIAAHPFQADQLTAQLGDRMATLQTAWDGSITGLSRLKSQLGRDAFGGTLASSRGLDRALYSDLRGAVEDATGAALGPEAGQAVSQINRQMGQHVTLRDVIGSAIARRASRDVNLRNGGGAFLDILRGGGWGALLGTAGHAVGLPISGPIGTAIGVTGRAIENSPPARRAIASIFDLGGTAASSPQAKTIFSALSAQPGAEAMRQKSSTADRSSSVPPGNTGPNTMAPLLDAIKQVESGGNSKAVSPKGALGPYQFTPATAKDYGVSDPFDEKQAREGAQKKLLADFQHFGDMRLALAAYNAGRARIDGLLKEAGGSTYADIEPLLKDKLRETYDYVPKVAAELAKLTG